MVAARANHADSFAAVAKCYAEGVGTDPDSSAAQFFRRRAADTGDADAAYAYAAEVGSWNQRYLFLKLAARAEHPLGMVAFADLLLDTPKNPLTLKHGDDEVLVFYLKAAQKGVADGYTGWARCLEGGIGLDADPAEAIRLYIQASELGSVRAADRLAEVLVDSDEYRKQLRRSAEGGSLDSQFQLSLIEAGEAQDANGLQAALQRMFSAAKAGHEPALLALANGYYEEMSEEMSFQVAKLASEAGHAPSMFVLAEKYTELDQQKLSAKWYEAASEAGVQEAFMSAAESSRYGSPTQVAWYERVLAAGNGDSAEVHLQLGLIYARDRGQEYGHWVARDGAKAIKHLKAASEVGRIEADLRLSELLLAGELVERDAAEASVYLRRSVAHGSNEARYLLATLYRGGVGVPRDTGKALSLFNKAAEHDHRGALLTLGRMYEQGEGAGVDLEKAAAHYSRAGSLGASGALWRLWNLHLSGRYLQPDPGAARRLLLGAARHGSYEACHVLAGYYMEGGGGFARNNRTAVFYLDKAGALCPDDRWAEHLEHRKRIESTLSARTARAEDYNEFKAGQLRRLGFCSVCNGQGRLERKTNVSNLAGTYSHQYSRSVDCSRCDSGRIDR